jgi:hypothetical protein
MGLNVYDYWRGLYPHEFLAHLLAFWKLRDAEKAHTGEAQQRAAEIKSKQKGRR